MSSARLTWLGWTFISSAVGFVLAVSANEACAQQDAQAEAAARVRQAKTPQVAAPLTTPAVPSKTAEDRSEASAKADGEALKRRGGERIGQGPRGRALVLGMHLQEGGLGQVKVVEVAAASAAFDAGIKEDDVLVSFAGFHADNYRKWIEGISRLATDAEDNSRLPVVLLRRGEQIDAQIRIPESHIGPVKLPIGPLPQQAQAPGPQGAIGVPVPVGGGDNLAIDNSGPFGVFFGGDTSPAAERAMAEIFRIGGAVTEPGPGATAGRPGTPGGGRGARIGMAGFRNDPNGMLVMVDVGGLPPGNYVVGISDPRMIGGQTQGNRMSASWFDYCVG